MKTASNSSQANASMATGSPAPATEVKLTNHAKLRMQQRGISMTSLERVIAYGRRIRVKGLNYLVLGRKEVADLARKGLNFSQECGLQALVSLDGAVVTVYRSQTLPRKDSNGMRGHFC